MSFAQPLTSKTTLVTVIHAQNETGIIQPLETICELAQARGVLVHTDAAQSAGKIDISTLAADFISIAGHKLYAPKGVGALIARAPLSPLLVGANHEQGRRPGTENLASIVGFGKACEIASRELGERCQRLKQLRDGLYFRLKAEIPDLILNSKLDRGLPNTLNISFPGVEASAIRASCPGIMASTGSACHGDEPSGALASMGFSAERCRGALRLSLGQPTTETEIEFAAQSLSQAFRALSGPG